MSKFNVKDSRAQAKASGGVIQTSATRTGSTHEGAPGYAYSGKSELFLLATTRFFGQDAFYEKADESSARFILLVKEITRTDPAWMLKFIGWLRYSGNMRTGAVVASVESAVVAAKAGQNIKHLAQGMGMARMLAQAGIGRADEIVEALAYWRHAHKGKQLPKPIKRGLADCLLNPKIVNEYTAMKYKSDGKSWSLGQAINVLHPVSSGWQSDLFGYLVAREYGEVEVPASLQKLVKRNLLMQMPVAKRRDVLTASDGATWLKDAGLTWESLAGWLQGPLDKAAWEAIIPSMGYFALLRNLRNFDQAGVSGAVANHVASKLGNYDEVKRSKLFPFRFLSAHREAPHIRWGAALAQALDHSVANVPALPGRTLVLVDTSGSMRSAFSEHSNMMRWDAAALFGIALAKAAEQVKGAHVDIVSYSDRFKKFEPVKGKDLLSECQRWAQGGYNIGSGTMTAQAVSQFYQGHDRVIILTDEQAHYQMHAAKEGWGYYAARAIDAPVPADKHVFTFNLAGYKQGHLPTSATRHSFGGLTDACFSMIKQIEQGCQGRWPWESEQ